MRDKAPIQLQESVADHTKKRKRTEAILKISSQDRHRVLNELMGNTSRVCQKNEGVSDIATIRINRCC